jgi:hypothetical protein
MCQILHAIKTLPIESTKGSKVSFDPAFLGLKSYLKAKSENKSFQKKAKAIW